MKRKILLVAGLLFVLIPFLVNEFSYVRLVSLLIGIILLAVSLVSGKKIIIFTIIYFPLLMLLLTYSVDYMMSCVFGRNPIYAIENKSSETVSTYNSFMYRVFDCNNNLMFDNNYHNNYMCKTSLLNNTDINEVLTEPSKYFKHHKNDYIKVTGKISKINGNTSIEMRSFIQDKDNILNGYVLFDNTDKVDILISNKMDVSHYKIYDYISVVGKITSYENHSISLTEVVFENNNKYLNYDLSVIEPEKCENEITQYTDEYYTYCLSNIYVDYYIDKYELSYALKDKKITFDNLKKNYKELKEEDGKDLYILDKFDILVCSDKRTIFLNKATKKPFNICDGKKSR